MAQISIPCSGKGCKKMWSMPFDIYRSKDELLDQHLLASGWIKRIENSGKKWYCAKCSEVIK